MRHVVLDEADLLLTGGYEKDTRRILQAFQEGDRQQRASAAAQRFGLTDDMLQRMPRQLRRAAKKGRPSRPAEALRMPRNVSVKWHPGNFSKPCLISCTELQICAGDHADRTKQRQLQHSSCAKQYPKECRIPS